MRETYDKVYHESLGDLIELVKREPDLKEKERVISQLRALQDDIANGRKRPVPCKDKKEGTEWQPI
jgi:hypothetical protein